MRKYIIISCLTLLFTSCASSYMSYQQVTPTKKVYNKLLVLSIFDPIRLDALYEDSYYDEVQPFLNDLESISVRQLMEDAFEKKFSNERLDIQYASKTFKTNTYTDFETFNEKLKDRDAILLINQSSMQYKPYTSFITIDNIESVSEDEAPEATFFVYLIDAKTLETIWVARADAHGSVIDGKHSLYRNLCRKVNRRLSKSQLLPPPLKVYNH